MTSFLHPDKPVGLHIRCIQIVSTHDKNTAFVTDCREGIGNIYTGEHGVPAVDQAACLHERQVAPLQVCEHTCPYATFQH